ncbi:esterase-like activity of phytase family protein [Streptomonospora litoralis]|uniref:WD40 repeat domain-containing protein n=1 Tax=Streptomonospora litoralis TaxID=2498135 RepID=A0A4V0ZJ53_9ACTN|nr:hypothetical protein [Streptomonospora litoralis]QBI52282.1 hypothetical protein EKD16_02330 [Streptomonospora litoralis]
MRKGAVVAASLALAVLPAPPAAAAPGAAAPGSPPDDSGTPAAAQPQFRITDERIQESSGLTASRRHDGVYWTHNDSGAYGPEIYAVDGQGRTVATVTLTGEGVEARDWEAIAVGAGPDGEPAVYVGDIGDNFQGGWPSIRVYRLPEPRRLTDQAVRATSFTLVYEDGGRDAEAMMVDPRDNRLYVLSKEIAGGVYAAPERLDPDGRNTLERVDSAPLYATDAAFSPDGAYYAVRTYWAATVYDASEGVRGRTVERVPLPESDQGESLAFSHDGRSLLAGTEGPGSPVWSMPLERAADADGGADPSADASGRGGGSAGGGQGASGAADADAGTGAAALIWTGVGLAAVVIAGIAVLARRS